MKVSLSWLKEYISVDLEPSVIAEKLTMAGLEVDAVEERYDYLANIVVAKVIDVKQHPNADKLSVCSVDAGGDKLVQIVCGAPNVKKGMFVPCALPGAVLPGDVKIKKKQTSWRNFLRYVMQCCRIKAQYRCFRNYGSGP